MPITIVTPKIDQAFGPGFKIQASSSFIGPIETGTKWKIEVRDDVGLEILVGECLWGTTTTTLDQVFPRQSDGHWNVLPVVADVVWGDWARIHLRLLDPADNELDFVSQRIHWEPQSGVPYMLANPQASGALTTEQALQLETTTAAMGFAIGGGWSELVEGLLNLVGRRLMGDELITPDRTGEGSLTRAGGPFGVNAFGIQWQVIERAPGIGIDEGAPDRTEINHQQLTLMRGTSQGLMPYDTKYIDDVNGVWMFGLDSPDQVDYFIMPGVTVRYWWKLLQIGGLEELQGDLASASPASGDADSQ